MTIEQTDQRLFKGTTAEIPLNVLTGAAAVPGFASLPVTVSQ